MTKDKRSPERRRVEALAKEYVRREAWTGRHHPMDDGLYEFRYALERLRRADEVVEFLNRTRRDPYDTLSNVDQTLEDAHSGLVATRTDLSETGFLDLLDDHFETVMRGLDRDGLPANEAGILRALGFTHLADTVWDQVELTAHEWQNGTSRGAVVAGEYRKHPASGALDSAISRVEEHQNERREFAQRAIGGDLFPIQPIPPDAPRKARRWWKGLGEIIQGASVAAVDAGMAVGIFKFPVSPETQTYGAVVSVTAGIGMIMNGVGDLWGE